MSSAGAPPLQLPGYTWDPETRRYFKQSTSAIRQTPASTARAATAAALAQAERERLQHQETSRRQARAKQARQRKLERDDEDGNDGLAAWRNSVLAPWLVQPAKRDKFKHALQGSHLATKIGSVRTIYPECLTMDDSIQHISFDETNPSTLRVGTSSGTIATGYLTRPPDEIDMYPNDEERWRTGWFCSSKITSLKTCGNRLVATCLGPPAQAIVGTTDDNISLASITLSPRKTSLWTSAISRDVVALGGDRSVLLCPLSSLSATTPSSGPSTPTPHPAAGGGMDAYVTGGRGGGGTVFALEMDEPGRTVWAGVRRGEVKGFDWRSRRGHSSTGGEEDSDSATEGGEVNFSLATPITHLRLIPGQPHQLLVAAMGGQLAIYDLRFLRPPRTTHSAALPGAPRPRKAFPRGRNNQQRQRPVDEGERPGGVHTPVSGLGPVPVISMDGHVNTFATDLGMDVWRDEWVAIAGQDSRLRIFSLRNGGLPLEPPPASSNSSFASSSSSSSTSAPVSWSSPPMSSSSSIATATGANNPAAHPLSRTFSEPIKSLAFSALDPLRLREKDYTRRILEHGGYGDGDDDDNWEQLRPRWDCPSLWVAEGAGVECFSVQ